MPMIDCHECGEKISDYADACPKCGARPKPAEQIGDWWPYRCKSCDLLIKAKVDKCPGCDADQKSKNLELMIISGICVVIAWLISRAIIGR